MNLDRAFGIVEQYYIPVAVSLGRQTWQPPYLIRETLKEIYLESNLPKPIDIVVSGETYNLSCYFIFADFVILHTPYNDIADNIIVKELSITVIENRDSKLAALDLSTELARRLDLPTVVLINLAVKYVFPIPRLALSVASLAAYIRKYQVAEVHIIDMQLDETEHSAIDAIRRLTPSLIGISISFGQLQVAQDLLDRIFDSSRDLNNSSIVVAGNVISTLARKDLLRKYPSLVICNGEGELTIAALIASLQINQTANRKRIPGISYMVNGSIRTNAKTHLEMDDLPLPALDTARTVVASGGAITLEISRGCSHSACSFCPRTHKPARWKGQSASTVIHQFKALSSFFDQVGCEPRIFLADEEFIGWLRDGSEALRIQTIMQGLIDLKIHVKFETNTRVDQIYDPSHDQKWHIDRMNMLSLCKRAGMDRILVGVESGSDSILERFNKKIRVQDSVMATRILSAMNIGRRITFITFDPLMTMSELKENVDFLGRKDIFLEPVDTSKVGHYELFDAIHDEHFVKKKSLDVPFYENVAYMLVSLEVLADSQYLEMMRRAEKRSSRSVFLNEGRMDVNMARYKITYRDPVIGVIATACQLWTDRHFSVDYTLKGLFKTASEKNRQLLFNYRKQYRGLSFKLLKTLISLLDDELDYSIDLDVRTNFLLSTLQESQQPRDDNSLTFEVLDHLSLEFSELLERVERDIRDGNIGDPVGSLQKSILRWRSTSSWDSIN